MFGTPISTPFFCCRVCVDSWPNLGHVFLLTFYQLGSRLLPSFDLIPMDVTHVVVLGKPSERGLDLFGGAVDDSALVMIAVGADEEGDGVVHDLFSLGNGFNGCGIGAYAYDALESWRTF